ncbi:unnamed protein product [Symbiodinium natans]|uniref:Glycosyltransferase family 92 protein n=1 Tax=Symbiodinium natans TaxID=878477 RepID=A0A812KM70_9DINO|nr:unnamed protein product [Symbiodinium natans]
MLTRLGDASPRVSNRGFCRVALLAGASLAPILLLALGFSFPIRCLGNCLAQESRRCLLMSLWLPTEIELNHYALRSREEFLQRRAWRLHADGFDDSQLTAEFVKREEREHMSSCQTPGRQMRFLPVMDAFRSMTWPERQRRFHTFEYQGRSHFITAVLEVNLATSEDEYLLEWIDFHSAAGMDHFVIYDAKNLTSTRQMLEPYTARGIVDLWPCRPTASGSCIPTDELVPGNGPQQRDFRMFAVTSIARQKSSFWIAQLDLDEFMFPRRRSSLRDVLWPETQPDGVQMFFVWQLNHGSAGWIAKPPMRQIEAYTRCSQQRDWNGKSIAQADSIQLTGPKRYTGDPHRLVPEDSQGVTAAWR